MALAPDTVYTKTAKGLLELRNKGLKLPREMGQVLNSIDGRTSVGELLPASGMTMPQLQHALNTLAADGYIKAVAPAVQQTASDESDLDFTSPQAMATLNAEAASRALAAADAAKRAQAEARAALEARLRVEAEARARALAETRAQAEAEARAKAEHAAREAAEARERAEREARAATDPAERAEAEARARAAAATAVRAEAEARARAEAEQRALADIAVKQAAEDRAREEAEQRRQAEEQAQARADAEARAGELLEAQVKAMQGAREFKNPDDAEAEAARARVRELERQAEQARMRAREIAEAEGRADEVPEPEMDIADRVRQLNARVQAERRAREAARSGDAPAAAAGPAASTAAASWSALNKVEHAGDQATAAHDIAISIPEIGGGAAQHEQPAPVSQPEDSALPEVDLERAEQIQVHHTPDHVPSALEAAMLAHAAQAKTRDSPAAALAPAPAQAAAPEPNLEAAATAPEPEPAAPAEKLTPKLEDEDEPIEERLNVDRTAHDLIAEAAEARRRNEAQQLSARAAAARKQRQDEEARRVEFAARQKLRKKMLWGGAIAAIAVPAAAVAWLQFSPLDGYRADVQRALELRFNQPARVETVRYVLLPSPRLVLENVAIGQASGVRVRRIDAHVLPLAALSGPETFDLVEASGVEIDPPMLGTLPAWTGGRTAGSVHVSRLQLADAKISLPGAALEPFGGAIDFAPNGTVTSANFTSGKTQLVLTPSAEGVRVALDATAWRVPYGPALTFDRLKLSGLVDQRQIAAAEFTGTIAAGTLEGALNVRWAGPIALEGEFKLDNARLQDMLAELTPNFSARGTLKGTGRFSMQAADWAALPRNPQLAGTFTVSRGELLNIDLVRAIRSPAVGALRGGRTQFESLSGSLQVTPAGYAYRQLQLASGALNANGTLDVAASRQLSGRLSAELATRGSVVARSQLVIGGTVQDPQLTR